MNKSDSRNESVINKAKKGNTKESSVKMLNSNGRWTEIVENQEYNDLNNCEDKNSLNEK